MSTGGQIRHEYTAPVLTLYGSVRALTGAASGSNGDGVGLGKRNPSDPALKENVVRVGEHPAGFGLYLFDYKAELRDTLGHDRKFGVMADEVEKIVPQAVIIGEDGYRTVDYSMLGITLH